MINNTFRISKGYVTKQSHFNILALLLTNIIEQLLDDVEQNIVICQWRADQKLMCETLANHDIF